MAPAHQFLQLLPTLTDFLLHNTPCHAAMRHTRLPDVFRPLPKLQMVLRHRRNPLLVLPDQVRHIAHRHRQQRPRGHGPESEGRGRAEENAAVARDDRTGHGGDHGVDTTGKQVLTGFGRGSQRGNGVGESVLDVQGPRQKVIEAVLDGKGVVVDKETSLADLGRQDICGSRFRGSFGLGLALDRRFFGSWGRSRFEVGKVWQVIVNGFFLPVTNLETP